MKVRKLFETVASVQRESILCVMKNNLAGATLNDTPYLARTLNP
jgi:hypothetical protein